MKKQIIFILSFVSIQLIAQNQVFGSELPPIRLKYASVAFTGDGVFLGYIGQERRVEVKSLNDISPYVKKCLLATEDRDFYNHNGVSISGLGRAVIKSLQGKTQGGSTLTMQLARNLFLTQEKTLNRKFNEINLALELEKHFTKDQLMLLYLNTVYFGHGVYGIWAASRDYYSKLPSELTLAEAALIVGLLQSPSHYDPTKNPEKALRRRNEVLHNLFETGNLSESDYNKQTKIAINLKVREELSPYFEEYVRRFTENILKQNGKSLDNGTYKIYTTLDSKIQKAANLAVAEQYKAFPSKLKSVQIGLISIDPVTGFIKAMIGGSPGSDSKGLNRSYQIYRQVGSAFKPFLYSYLLKTGYTLAAPLFDGPITVYPGTANEWTPNNYDGTSSNSYVTMKNAIMKSLNLPAVNAIMNLTTPQEIADYAEMMGVRADIQPFPSIALGACESNPYRMASSFSVFASNGLQTKTEAVLKIEDQSGQTIYYAQAQPQVVLDAETCYLTNYALSAVVDSGTAATVRKFFKGTAAGKTGTTQDNSDAWFIGYTPELTTAVWLGNDIPTTKLGNKNFNGGTIAAPIWGRMYANIQNLKKGFLAKQFKTSEKIQMIELCNETGLSPEISDPCNFREIYPVNMDLYPFKMVPFK